MKKIDITDRLDFSGNPALIIKGEEIEVNSDTPTVLKVMKLMDENTGPEEIAGAYELLFPTPARKKLEKLGINFAGLVTVIQSAVELITGSVMQGEAETHTTT